MSYAAEADMFHAAVFGAFHTTGNTITGTIRVITEKRAAADDTLGSEGFIRVVAFNRPCRIRRTIGLTIVVVVIIICTPFPDIARHIIESIAIRNKRGYGSCMVIMIYLGVFVREVTIPEIAFGLTGVDSFITPGVDIVF